MSAFNPISRIPEAIDINKATDTLDQKESGIYNVIGQGSASGNTVAITLAGQGCWLINNAVSPDETALTITIKPPSGAKLHDANLGETSDPANGKGVILDKNLTGAYVKIVSYAANVYQVVEQVGTVKRES